MLVFRRIVGNDFDVLLHSLGICLDATDTPIIDIQLLTSAHIKIVEINFLTPDSRPVTATGMHYIMRVPQGDIT